MILVDTSVWVDHLRTSDAALARALEHDVVLVHPWVIGELALGRLRNRAEILGLLAALPRATLASDHEVLHLIDEENLYGCGIGYVDAQLLAATRLTPETTLWTRDKRLRATADHLGLSHPAEVHGETPGQPPATDGITSS